MSGLSGTPKVVASDIDGTLVNSKGEVSLRTRAALDRAREQGALLIFVTGRPPRWMDSVIEETGAVGPCDPGQRSAGLRPGHSRGRAPAQPGSGECRTAGESDPCRYSGCDVRGGIRRGLHPRTGLPALVAGPGPGRRGSGADAAQSRWPSCWSSTPTAGPDDIHPIVAEIAGEDATVTYSGDVLLEVSGAGISKASTLEVVCAEHGVGPEGVVAFGDMPNDVPMLAWAGHGVRRGQCPHERLSSS